jgi:phospholipid/cholesterol/gamma-HCH transport system substrate-binding protein
MSDVSELQVSSPVYVDGFKVGIVSAINFHYNRPGNTMVQVSLDKNMKVPAGSYAELKSGLTSGAYLSLRLNTYVGTYLAIGDTITGQSHEGLMDQLSATWPQVENLLPRLDSILSGIQMLVNHPALNQSLTQIEATTAGLQKSSEQLNALLAKDVPVVLSNLNKVSSDFAVLSGNLKEVDVQGTVATLDQTLGNIHRITQQLNDSTNSLGLLLNDRSLYQHLDSTARNASELLLDLKQNPKRYVHFSIF